MLPINCQGQPMAKPFQVPAAPMHRVEQVLKRSRFITSLSRAENVETARAFINRIKDEFPDATHNCWAFNAGPPGDTAFVGLSDDGEPHNSAGKPMLQTLLHSGVGEIAVVVTRYFGGVKLGGGGLVRAYSSSVALGLGELPLMEKRVLSQMSILLDYGQVDLFKRCLEAFKATVLAVEYADRVLYELELPEDEVEELSTQVTDLSSGRAVLTQAGTK